MIIIGLLLVALAVAVGADVIGQNRVENIQVHAVGHLFTASPGGLVALGAACGLVGAFGIMLLHDGTLRRQRTRVVARSATAERDDLAAQVERERAARIEAERTARVESERAAEPVRTGTISGEGTSQLVDLREDPVDEETATPSRRGLFHRT